MHDGEPGGALIAASEGTSHGTTFTLELPVNTKTKIYE